MMNYTTFTFERESHYNEFCPDTKMEFTTHQEERLENIVSMMAKFLVACGYSEKAVMETMAEYAENY